MKFQIHVTYDFFNKTCYDISWLKSIGFVFKEDARYFYIANDVELEISTIDELIKFQQDSDHELVIGRDKNGMYLEIYNGYRE